MLKTILASLLLVLALSGCGSSDKSTDAQPNSGEATTFQGTWASENANGAWMTAVFKNGNVTITLDDKTSKSLYWKGTFAKRAEDGGEILSVADRKALDRSILGSQNKTKKFVYKDNTLTFNMSAMGTTTKIELKESS